MKVAIILCATLIITILASACYYDSLEYLYPQINSQCDTIGTIPYGRVDSVFRANCMACHDGPSSSSGLDLTDYTSVNSLATHSRNGTPILQGAIRRMTPDFLAMPEPPAPALDICGIRIIELWIEQGAQPPQ